MAAFKVSVLKIIMVNPYFDLDFLMNDFIGYQVVTYLGKKKLIKMHKTKTK